MKFTQNDFARVQDTISELYRIFARYPFRLTYYCPCCLEKREVQTLSSTPLAHLTALNLRPYAVNAMLTAGDAEDVKYFLPRLFELSVVEECWPGVERFIDMIVRAGWSQWPTPERDALLAALLAFWDALLTASVHSSQVIRYINAVAQLNMLDLFFQRWQRACVPPSLALAHLASWIIDQYASLFIGQVKNSPQPQEEQTLLWLLGWQELENLFIQSFVETENLPPSPSGTQAQAQEIMQNDDSALQILVWLKHAVDAPPRHWRP